MIITHTQLLEIFHRRASTRNYDPSRKISDTDFNTILECGRLSPSSIGSEPWKFLIIQNPELRQKLKAVSWGMATQVDDCSHLVVFLTRKHVRFDSAYIREVLEQRGFNEEQIEKSVEKYRKFQTDDMPVLESERTLFDWSSKQTYIALANMLTGATFLGIDSCAVEGFDYAEVNRILLEQQLFDPNDWGVSVMATFGYRAKEIKPKSRKPLDEITLWVE